MNKYEKDLLNDLDYVSNLDEPLSNIKNEIGYISQIVGNPKFKAEINIQIRHVYLDLWAAPGNELIPFALVPAQLQVPLPIYLFGLTDFYGGFARSVLLTPPVLPFAFNPFVPVSIGIYQYTTAVPGLAVTNNLVSRGDLIIYLEDNTGQYACMVYIHCPNISYGTFLNSFVSDFIRVNRIRYFALPNINQLINPLVFYYQTLFGKIKSDSVDPRTYQTSFEFQNNISDIPISFPIDKNLFINFYCEWDCEIIDLVLFVNKIDPLTLRYK
jgi:hypothetical protein